MNVSSKLTKVGLAGAGLVAGVVLAGTIGAQAATPSPSPSASSSTTSDAHPGDNGADGVPESQEHHAGHDGRGGGLDLSGTVTALGSGSVTIKTATATTTYTVPSTADIDKNGEATLSALAVGDAVTFSVEDTNAKQIDKLHAGDEARNMPSGSAPSSSSSSTTTG
jgi:hypothetical protein